MVEWPRSMTSALWVLMKMMPSNWSAIHWWTLWRTDAISLRWSLPGMNPRNRWQWRLSSSQVENRRRSLMSCSSLSPRWILTRLCRKARVHVFPDFGNDAIQTMPDLGSGATRPDSAGCVLMARIVPLISAAADPPTEPRACCGVWKGPAVAPRRRWFWSLTPAFGPKLWHPSNTPWKTAIRGWLEVGLGRGLGFNTPSCTAPEGHTMTLRRSGIRVLLFAGVSTVALTVGAAELRAADVPVPPRAVLKAPPAVLPPSLTIWIEGAAIFTGGSNMNALNPLGPTAFEGKSFDGKNVLAGPDFVSQRPKVGWEGAFGADYRLPGLPGWHVSFDVRYGKSKADRQDFSSSNSDCFEGIGSFCYVGFSASSQARFTENEDHLVADFMGGRALALGLIGLNQ